MSRALITGVSGQDGAYLAAHLVSLGYKVVGTVRSYRSRKVIDNFKYLSITEKIQLVELDLTDVVNIISLIKRFEPTEIYNLAAQSSVGSSFEQPLGTFNFNTNSVNNLLEAIRIINPKIKLYQASSSEMYGSAESLPINTRTAMNPMSPYGVSKMAAHYMALNYRDAYGLFVCTGILFNHESHLRSENFFVKKVISGAFDILSGLKSDLRVGNLDIRRDFGYAPCYVEAMHLMMQKDKPGNYFICSGESISLREITQYVFDQLSIERNLIIEDINLCRPNEILDSFGDNTISKKELNWNYSYSFREVLDILIEEERSARLSKRRD